MAHGLATRGRVARFQRVGSGDGGVHHDQEVANRPTDPLIRVPEQLTDTCALPCIAPATAENLSPTAPSVAQVPASERR